VTSLETMILESAAAGRCNTTERLAFMGQAQEFLGREIADEEAMPTVGIRQRLAEQSCREANRRLVAEPKSPLSQAWFHLHQHLGAEHVSSLAGERLVAELEEWRAEQ